MRLVIDTNVLISALLVETSLPALLIVLWREGRFDVLTSAEQLDEIRRVTRYPKLRARLAPPLAGRLINELRDVAVMVERLPTITACADPNDNYLLAMCVAGHADRLITGDKRDVLSMQHYGATQIFAVRDFLASQGRLPPP